MTTFKPIAAISLKYIDPVKITAEDLDGVAFDPTSDTVKFAFVADGTDLSSSSTFYTGLWGTKVTGSTSEYRATCLIGPGGGQVTLAPGVYNVWVKITDSPEVPVEFCGQLVITEAA